MAKPIDAADLALTNQMDPATKVEGCDPPAEMTIAGLAEPTILQYFTRLNAGAFADTAALFASDGVLYPPFDSPLTGPKAIAAYLEAEAKQMQLDPREGVVIVAENGDREIKVAGKVQTPLFGVNVSWYFVLNANSEILAVRIKLMAALEELLKYKK